MLSRLKIAATLAFIASTAPAMAASLYLQNSTDDPVGKRLAYEVREQIARSARNKLVLVEEDAAFILRIVTLNPSETATNQTIYSLVLTMKQFSKDDAFDLYLSSWVGHCGRDVVTSCAANLAANVDGEIQPITEVLVKALKDGAARQRPTS